MEKTNFAVFPDRRLVRRRGARPLAGGASSALRPLVVNARFNRLADRVLGTEPKQRIRLVQCGMAILLALGSVANMAYLVWAGFASAEPVRWWSLGVVGGFAVFFYAIRSGYSLRFTDPSLTVPQMVYAICCAAIAYALAGHGRGSAFPILMVTFMFSMYSLPPAHVRRAGYFAVTVFGLSMALMSHRNPQVFNPAVEWGHFMMIAIMVPAISALAGHLSRLRSRLRRQKKDLALALGRIQDLATRDELTGLINRRHMHDLMEQERQRGVRSGQTFCIAVLELDDFDRLHDELGMEASDVLLQRFAQEALHVVRISDLLCRWDQKRFLLMLSNTRISLAKLGLERLHERGRLAATDASEFSGQLAFSAGLVEHRAGESVAQAIDRAESGLRAAVEAGRNRVMMA